MIKAMIGLAAVVALAGESTAHAAPPQMDCEGMDWVVRQARVDLNGLKGKQIARGKCALKAGEYGCTWAFPGDAFGAAEQEAARLERCVAAYPGARKAEAKGRDAVYEIEPDIRVTLPTLELDRDGYWAVRFKLKLIEAR